MSPSAETAYLHTGRALSGPRTRTRLKQPAEYPTGTPRLFEPTCGHASVHLRRFNSKLHAYSGLAPGTEILTLDSQALAIPCGGFGTQQQNSDGSMTDGSLWAELDPGLGGIGCNPDPPDPATPTYAESFHHRDHLGSLRVASDKAGWAGPTDRIDYYPFGMKLGEVPAGDASRRWYTGHERDGATGLDYMLARYMGLSVGRFIRVDPNPGTLLTVSWNKYTYVSNNPYAKVDPDGRETIVFIVARAGSGSKGIFGHAAAIATTDRGERASISRGTNTRLEPSIAAFVNAYLEEGRAVTAFVLADDPVRDEQMVGALVRENATKYNALSNNCTTAVANALRESGVISEGQNPEEGVIFDSPGALADALWWTPELASQVESILIFDPDLVGAVPPEQIEELLGIADSADVEPPVISKEPPNMTREQAREARPPE